MQVQHNHDATVVRFSATEVAAAGLPARPAFVTYRAGLLDGYSVWLEKQMSFDRGIDRLVALADEVVYH